jgi:hypothetical protein
MNSGFRTLPRRYRFVDALARHVEWAPTSPANVTFAFSVLGVPGVLGHRFQNALPVHSSICQCTCYDVEASDAQAIPESHDGSAAGGEKRAEPVCRCCPQRSGKNDQKRLSHASAFESQPT